jgi:glycosyltransferase involved in cell wall biosynthesis
MTPAVSVAIATYNYARFLPAAIESVLGQTMGDLEIIVIDDGSTDDTPVAMERYRKEPRVRYERIAHVGVAAAKNAAIRRARAPVVALLDADDVWLSDKLERQMPLMDAAEKPAVVYSRRLEIDENGNLLKYRQPVLHRGRVLAAMFRENFVCYSSALVRREVFDHAGYFDEGLPLAVDYDFWLRVALCYSFDYVDEPLVKYRRGHGSLSSRDAERTCLALEIMDRFLERGGREALSPAVIRRARAETYCTLVLALRDESRLSALGYNLKALALAPGCGKAWKSLASLPMSEPMRQFTRRMLGRAGDSDGAISCKGSEITQNGI